MSRFLLPSWAGCQSMLLTILLTFIRGLSAVRMEEEKSTGPQEHRHGPVSSSRDVAGGAGADL